METNINTYEMIYMVLQNDEDSLSDLFQRLKRMIDSCVNKYLGLCQIGYQIEDLKQVAYFKLWECIYCFRDDKGMTFEQYSYVCIQRQLANLKRGKGFSHIYVELQEHSEYSRYTKEVNVEQLYIKERTAKYIAGLEPMAQRVIQMRAQGYRYQEIADILHIKPKKVEYILLKCRKLKGFID